MPDTSGNLGERTASGAAWLTIQTVLARVIGLLSQLALAWLLAKEQFGQIALVYTITAFTTQLVNPGVDTVLLQKQKHIHHWVTPAFWLCMICGIAASVIMLVAGFTVVALASNAGNSAYGDINLFWMILILATGAPFNAAALVPMVMLQNQMRFAKISGINFGEAFLQQAMIVTLAALGCGAYSFVIPMPIVSMIRFIVLWRMTRPPVRAKLALHRWGGMIQSTGWMFGTRLLATVTAQGDRIVLGLFFLESVVGDYFFAFILSTQILRMLCDNIGAALLPALTAIKDDPVRMEQAARRAMRALTAMVTPLAILQILLAGSVIRVLYHPKWETTIELVQWLSASALLFATIWPIGMWIVAAGRFRDSFFAWVFNSILFFALVIPFALQWAALGAAIAVTIWSWIVGLTLPVVAYRSMRGAWMAIEAVSRPLAAGVAGMVPGALILWLLPETTAFDILAIVLVAPMVFVTYLVCLRALDHTTFDMVLDRMIGAAGPIYRRLLMAISLHHRNSPQTTNT